MNSLTRIGLPILVVVGAVFGITFVRMYSTDDPAPLPATPSLTPGKPLAKPPLTMNLATAAPVTGKPEAWQVPLTYWNPEVEVGVPGHFEFWCQNPNPEPVNLRVYDANCQCAEVELAAVPHDALREYAVGSALAGGPLGFGAPLAALAHVQFNRRLTWEVLLETGSAEKEERTIPPTSPATGPQVALVRLGWQPKEGLGPKEISARLAATTGDRPPKIYEVRVRSITVPAFDVIRRTGPSEFAPARELPVGDLRENSQVKQVVYLLSTTRRYPAYSVSMESTDPCVTWTDPAPASPAEVQAVTEYFSHPERHRRPLSIQRFEVAVRERTTTEAGGKPELHQLDLGVLDRRLRVSAVAGGDFTVRINGRVLGDVRFLTGAADGQIELGDSFSTDQDRTVTVLLLAEKDNLGLRVAENETTPNYLKVRLDPLAQIDGRNQWRLRVTVPKGSLVGALPPGSAVVLQTVGPNPRRLRIPVRGTTFDSGGPRL